MEFLKMSCYLFSYKYFCFGYFLCNFIFLERYYQNNQTVMGATGMNGLTHLNLRNKPATCSTAILSALSTRTHY